MSKVSNQLVTLCKANLFVRQGYEADEVWGQSDSPADRESLKHLHSALTECLSLHKFYKVCFCCARLQLIRYLLLAFAE